MLQKEACGPVSFDATSTAQLHYNYFFLTALSKKVVLYLYLVNLVCVSCSFIHSLNTPIVSLPVSGDTHLLDCLSAQEHRCTALEHVQPVSSLS